MPIQIITLKLDFKFDEHDILRIIDLGDGFGSGKYGFEDPQPNTKMLADIHAATGASIATLFGELAHEAMQPETINLPYVLRQPASAGGAYTTNDLPSDQSVLPYSQFASLAAYASHIWGKQKSNIFVAPAGLVALEMHKIFWYFLMQKHLAADQQTKFLFWSNHTNPAELNLNELDLRHGVFVKIVDRSTGGGNEVFYAGNKKEILEITNALHMQYKHSDAEYKQHIFVIEPAYITMRQYQNENYNVTGRVFVTLIYDKEKQIFDVKIAAAKWIFPLESLSKEHTSAQMLSNVKNHSKMLSLNSDELNKLSAGITQTCRDAFQAGIENVDLLTYFADHLHTGQLVSCLRPDSSYGIYLNRIYHPESYNNKIGSHLLDQSVASFICRDMLAEFKVIVDFTFDGTLLSSIYKPATKELLEKICLFSLFECYVAHLKATKSVFLNAPQLADLVKREPLIKSKLNRLILQFIKAKNPDYDTQDLNRALRQAAAIGDILIVKLLIYTHRAKHNALSASNKTPLDYALTCKNAELKKSVLKLLSHVGAKTGEEMLVTRATVRL